MPQVHQDLQLYTSLMLKSFFVSDQLYGHILLSFVVEAFDSLTKTSFAKKFNDFKSVCDMVLNYYLVVSSLIVIAKVIGMKRRTLDLLGFNTKVVDLLVVENLSFFMVSQVAHEKFEGFSWSDWIFQVFYLLLKIFNCHSS